MARRYIATFTGFTGAQFATEVLAYSITEAREVCEEHMCAGDTLTIEEAQS